MGTLIFRTRRGIARGSDGYSDDELHGSKSYSNSVTYCAFLSTEFERNRSELIYNVLGQEVIRLADENQNAGYYAARWDGVNAVGNPVTTGLYFYKLEARGADGKTFHEVRRMLLLK